MHPGHQVRVVPGSNVLLVSPTAYHIGRSLQNLPLMPIEPKNRDEQAPLCGRRQRRSPKVERPSLQPSCGAIQRYTESRYSLPRPKCPSKRTISKPRPRDKEHGSESHRSRCQPAHSLKDSASPRRDCITTRRNEMFLNCLRMYGVLEDLNIDTECHVPVFTGAFPSVSGACRVS
jgi:hypothetical protein